MDIFKAKLLDPGLKKDLRNKGYNTLESVYGAMVGTPEIFKKYLIKFYDIKIEGHSEFYYNMILQYIKKLLPEEVTNELDKPTEKRSYGVLRRKNEK
jgi:hypothetical protein